MKRPILPIIAAFLSLVSFALMLPCRSNALVEARPERAPNAENRLSAVALPFGGSGIPINALGVAQYIDSSGSIKQVMRWDLDNQILQTYNVGLPFGNFPVSVGDPLLLSADSAAPSSFAWTGDVPPAGTITYTLQPNRFHYLMIPLDQSGINMASDLAASIGGVTQVSQWDATNQILQTYNVGLPFGNFPVNIGYPYFVQTNASAPSSWP